MLSSMLLSRAKLGDISLTFAGSMYCFRVADAYLKGFSPIRSAVVTGNHDLEGEDFETDEANLAAWTKVSQIVLTCVLPGNTGSYSGCPKTAHTAAAALGVHAL